MHTELTHIKTELKPVFGGQKVIVTYELRTASDDTDVVKANLYEVVGEVTGLDAGDGCDLRLCSVKAQSNNEDTLTDEAVNDIMADNFNWV